MPHQMKKICVNDKIAKYYAMRKGQICQIKNSSENSGNANAYRIVV